MTTKQPATPLPWSFDRGSIDAQSADVRAPSLASSVRAEDGRYIVHACNAYPELVAALQAIAQQYSIGDARPNDLALAMADKARALLAKLGETA